MYVSKAKQCRQLLKDKLMKSSIKKLKTLKYLLPQWYFAQVGNLQNDKNQTSKQNKTNITFK